jgi:hypothetical protein
MMGEERGSIVRGLRVRLGERRGDEGRSNGMGEGEGEGERAKRAAGRTTEGIEWARVMGGALEPLLERRWERA